MGEIKDNVGIGLSIRDGETEDTVIQGNFTGWIGAISGFSQTSDNAA
jgi:hypothetical protein